MNPDLVALKQFVDRMQAIAQSNGDTFKTTIVVEDTRYFIKVVETGDQRTFLSGSGPTLNAALSAVLNALPLALHNWGYKDNQLCATP
jgi:hypothetical protein